METNTVILIIFLGCFFNILGSQLLKAEEQINRQLLDMEVIFVKKSEPFYFVVNRGKRHGLKRGDIICAITGYGDGSETSESSMAHPPSEFEQCGAVVSLKNSVAAVAVSKQQTEKIKVEHAARLFRLPEKTRAPTHLTLGYHFAEKSSYQYNLIKFNINAFITETEPVWMTETSRSGGYGVPFFAIAIQGSQAWPFGSLRLKITPIDVPEDFVAVDYSIGDPAIYAKTSVKAKGSEVDFQVMYDFPVIQPHLTLSPILGLSLTQMQLKNSVHVLNENTGEKRDLVDHQARWTGFGITTGIQGRGKFGGLIAEGHWGLRAPIWMSSLKQKATIDLPAGLPADGADSEAFKRQAGVKKGPLSQFIVMALGWEF